MKPDSVCLNNACKNKHGITLIKLLISHGAVPDLNCIVTFSNSIGNRTMKYLLEQYSTKNNIITTAIVNNDLDNKPQKKKKNLK